VDEPLDAGHENVADPSKRQRWLTAGAGGISAISPTAAFICVAAWALAVIGLAVAARSQRRWGTGR
jgi:hypothetical protein